MNSFLQSPEWGKFKESAGWESKTRHGLLELSRTLPMGKVLSYYPELDFTEDVLEGVNKIIGEDRSSGKMLVRFEFLTPWKDEIATQLLKAGLIKSFEEVQPEYRRWIDLNLSEEGLLNQMKQKGRYNVRVAERHKLKIEHGSTKELAERFFNLYKNTAKRADFQGRNLNYFVKLVELIDELKNGEVILVSKGDEDLSGGIFIYQGEIASYLYGGSGGDRSLMAPYLMHWEAMKRAKKRDCAIYDLIAVAPPETENHPYSSLTRFKEQFGGATVRMVGSWDLVVQPFWYKLYRTIEKRRRKVAH